MASDVTSLDPALMVYDNSLLVNAQIYETLVQHEPGGTGIVPGLASSWDISTDGLTWTFTLQPNVTFHDGTNLDAAAVVYNVERWWDPAHPQHVADWWLFNRTFGSVRGDPGCNIVAVSAVGADQVQITLREPDSRLLSFLAMPFFAITSPSALQAGTLETAPVGTGPFTFVEQVLDSHVQLAANSAYWGDGPRLASLVFRVISDQEALFAALQSGAVHGTSDLGADYVGPASQDANLEVLWTPATHLGYLGINAAHPPLDNPLVRQAIAHALNKQALIDTYYPAQVGQVAGQLLSPVVWGHDPALSDYPHSASEARNLLTQAGYSAGFTTTLRVMPVARSYFLDPAAMAESMQADLESVGISATLVTRGWNTYRREVLSGEADLFMLGWIPDYGHPYNYFGLILCQGQSRGPLDTELCDRVQQSLAQHNTQALEASYRWVSRRVHDTVPLVPIAHTRQPVLVRSNVEGVVPAAMYAACFKDVYF
jgi:peptide/nickel transport system substrate-binding protein